MSLHLMHCVPDPRALAVWATRQGLLSPDGDYGYALHALLRAAFGEEAPKPFRYLDSRQGILAYSRSGIEVLRDTAVLAPPDVARALGLDSLDARHFPGAWRTRRKLGFEVRVRPVVRAKDGRERDVFLHAVEAGAPREGTEAAHRTEEQLAREPVYRDWLVGQLVHDNAARVLRAGMDAFRLTRVMRRSHRDAEGKRRMRTPSGPDAVFRGELEIRDAAAFADLVSRGIGRHRAFGFGMLLLRPANRC